MGSVNRVNRARGFTLVELMVTVTIMLIMAAVVFFNYGKFNESSIMNQVAYDMSLTIRQAQVYGVASKEGGSNQSGVIDTGILTGTNANNFKHAYGVHFDMNNPGQFSLFVDSDDNNYYTDSNSDTVLQTYSFQREIHIKYICFLKVVSQQSNECDHVVGTKGQLIKDNKSLDIMFLRPDPEADMIPESNAYYNNLGKKGVSRVTIYLKNKDETITKFVDIYMSGQISVQ